MKKLVLSLLVLMLPAVAAAQEAKVQYKEGMVMENGTWRKPTPETALRDIMMPGGMSMNAAVAVLRQTFDARSASELDAFADQLMRLAREGTEAQWVEATVALIIAAKKDYEGGTPYVGAVDAAIRFYESFEGRTSRQASRALRVVIRAGGEDYVRKLFESSEPPTKPCLDSYPKLLPGEELPPREAFCPYTSAWCVAGKLLILNSNGTPDDYMLRLTCLGYARH